MELNISFLGLEKEENNNDNNKDNNGTGLRKYAGVDNQEKYWKPE